MAIVRMSLDEARRRQGWVDQAKLDATTEDDVRRQMIEDGQDPDADPGPWTASIPAREVRAKLGLTPPQMADLLHVPLATWEEWERSVHPPDPGARQLLLVLYREPEAALRALGQPSRAAE